MVLDRGKVYGLNKCFESSTVFKRCFVTFVTSNNFTGIFSLFIPLIFIFFLSGFYSVVFKPPYQSLCIGALPYLQHDMYYSSRRYPLRQNASIYVGGGLLRQHIEAETKIRRFADIDFNISKRVCFDSSVTEICWIQLTTNQLWCRAWASYQIRKIAGCACAGNAGNVSPRRQFQRKPLVSDPGMHHGTCVTHVP